MPFAAKVANELATSITLGLAGSVNVLAAVVSTKYLRPATNVVFAEIAEELALPPVKIHCSILAEDAIKAAVEDYRKKHDLHN